MGRTIAVSLGAKYKTLSKSERIEVYNKYKGHCAYCGCKLEYKDMQVDHLIPLYWSEKVSGVGMNRKDLDSFENFMPACRMCNFYKSTMSLENFRVQLETLHQRLEKQFIYKLARKYGLILEHPHHIKFYFEKSEEERKALRFSEHSK